MTEVQSRALFNPKTVARLAKDTVITQKQRKAAREWIQLLESKTLGKEKQNYLKFALIVLQELLNYQIRTDLDHEKDNVEFSCHNQARQKSVCIEVKGSAKDLSSDQGRDKPEHQTPIKQAWDYMGSGNYDYAIATNYRRFVLIDKTKGYSTYHDFDFMSIKAEGDEKLKEFLAVFSKESILDTNFIQRLFDDSVTEEIEFTKQFYKLYHETRLMLIREFQESGTNTSERAIHYAQLYLNRLVFLFFAEDTDKVKKKLFYQSILQSLNPLLVSDASKYVSDTIRSLFVRLDKGSKSPIEIFGFNGGLFAEKIPDDTYFKDMREKTFFKDVLQDSKLTRNVKLDSHAQKLIDSFEGRLNPIISNLLRMSSFDFSSELNVNILGHIFEQSISDIEILRGQRTWERKRGGIFYTPEYVTSYICRNTIIPYLSKNGVTTIPDLIAEYSDNIVELEKRFKDIKILDPACGSGAFLLKAVDVLLAIYKEIQAFKESEGQYTVTAKGKGKRSIPAQFYSFKKWEEEDEARKIVENNIYGVDINEESVEITKLSLFLRIATTNRKLIDLSSNIKMGNSIIADGTISQGRAFQWEKQFDQIKGRFDIVIGNPPYIPLEDMADEEAAYYSRTYKGIFRKYDTSVLFVERALSLLREGGLLGFIMPLTWQTGDNYYKFRKMIFIDDKATLRQLINLPFNVFPDAYVDTGIAIFRKKDEGTPFLAYQYEKNQKITSIEPEEIESIEKSQLLEEPDLKVFPNNGTYEILKKVRKGSIDLGAPLTDSCQGIVTSKFPISKTKASDNYWPFLLEADSNRYRFVVRSSSFIDFSQAASILHLYTQPKIMIRRIVNRQNRLMAFHDDSGIITNKDYNPFIIQEGYREKYDIFYLLALLNSKLFSFLYTKKSSLALKDDFRQTTLAEIRKLPVKDIPKNEQSERLGEKAKNLTKLYENYYGLKDKLLRRIEENFKVTASKKLNEITDMTFSEVKSEIESLANRKMTLLEQDEWERYFWENIDQLKVLRDKINVLENTIDEEVFNLYEISQKERALINESLRERSI